MSYITIKEGETKRGLRTAMMRITFYSSKDVRKIERPISKSSVVAITKKRKKRFVD
jgi:hypothetical protein